MLEKEVRYFGECERTRRRRASGGYLPLEVMGDMIGRKLRGCSDPHRGRRLTKQPTTHPYGLIPCWKCKYDVAVNVELYVVHVDTVFRFRCHCHSMNMSFLGRQLVASPPPRGVMAGQIRLLRPFFFTVLSRTGATQIENRKTIWSPQTPLFPFYAHRARAQVVSNAT